jgi:aminopeptidase-like protein
LVRFIQVVECNHSYLNLNPKCEPQLGRRGLYRQMGGTNSSLSEEAMLWVLSFSDGDNSLLDIAERSKLDFISLAEAAGALLESGLLKRLE